MVTALIKTVRSENWVKCLSINRARNGGEGIKSIILISSLALAIFAGRSVASGDLPILPGDVLWVFVFYQDPGNHERGSGKEIARRLKPREFLSNFASYKSQAKSQNKQLIIIAQSKIGKWVQDQITYRGKSLARVRYFNPRMDGVYFGAEIPLD